MDPGAARERVRVARALGGLPLLARALARGELSYAKVRARTRVATAETEERLLAVGRAGTAEHVERIVRGWRRVDRQAEAQESAQRHKSRALHVYQDEDGMVVLRGRLEPEVGALVMQALAAAREALYQKARAQEQERSADADTHGAAPRARARDPRGAIPGGGPPGCRGPRGTPMRLASRSSRRGLAFPRKRPSAWRVQLRIDSPTARCGSCGRTAGFSQKFHCLVPWLARGTPGCRLGHRRPASSRTGEIAAFQIRILTWWRSSIQSWARSRLPHPVRDRICPVGPGTPRQRRAV